MVILYLNGDFYPKWMYENAIDKAKCDTEAEALSDCGHYERIRDLENELDTIKRIASYE